MAKLLACLPTTTAVILRTPYFADAMGSVGANCIDRPGVTRRVSVSRDVMLRMHRQGAFGNSTLVVDAYALTQAAAAHGSPALASLDGHHFPPPVRKADLSLMLHAYSVWKRSHHRLELCATTTATSGAQTDRI